MNIKKIVVLLILFFVPLKGAPANDTDNAIQDFSSSPLTLNFIEPRSKIYFTQGDEDTQGITVRLTVNKKRTECVFVDKYEPEGGRNAVIVSTFLANADKDKTKELFVIVKWPADVPALDTGGSIYEVRVYDDKIIYTKHDHPLLARLENISKKFGSGFEGHREGIAVHYSYKDASSVRRQLEIWGY